MVRSKSQGSVGLLIGTTSIPIQSKIATPGKPPITRWIILGVVLVDKSFDKFDIDDLEPISMEELESVQTKLEAGEEAGEKNN